MRDKIQYGFIKTTIKFVGVLSGAVGIISFIFFLSQKSIHYATEFVLFSINVFLFIVILKLKRSLDILSSEYSNQEELHYEHLALTFFTNPDPLIEDGRHRFILREEHFSIQGHDAFFKFRFQGINASDSPSRFIREKISDDAPIQIERLEFKATDNQRNMPLEWKVIKDQTYTKIIEIYFSCPLMPGDSFDISFSYKLCGSFIRKADYVFFPEHLYKKGTNKLIASLTLDTPPIRYELLRFDGKKFYTEEQPMLEIEKNGKALIKIERSNPKDLYLLKFVRRM